MESHTGRFGIGDGKRVIVGLERGGYAIAEACVNIMCGLLH